MNVSSTGYLFCYVSQMQYRVVMSMACADRKNQQDQDLIPYTTTISAIMSSISNNVASLLQVKCAEKALFTLAYGFRFGTNVSQHLTQHTLCTDWWESGDS